MAEIEIDDLCEFMHGFYGYGDLTSDVWLIGMEEGGGKDLAELNIRISKWISSGRGTTTDVYEMHNALSELRYFTLPKPKIQRTWSKLIRLQLSIEGNAVSNQLVANFQATRLGRTGSNTCLLELLPLPASNLNSWIYKELTSLSCLNTRAKYRRALLPVRINKLRNLITNYKPKTVVFYGLSYKTYWQEIMQSQFVENDTNHFFTQHQKNGINYVLAPHPSARGVKNKDFESFIEDVQKSSNTDPS